MFYSTVVKMFKTNICELSDSLLKKLEEYQKTSENKEVDSNKWEEIIKEYEKRNENRPLEPGELIEQMRSKSKSNEINHAISHLLQAKQENAKEV